LPPAKGELLEPVRLADERARLNSIWPQAALLPQWTGVFTRPLSVEFPTTSPFGTRRSYNGGPVSSFHEGQDFGAPEGTAVLAPAPGQVVLAEELTVRGNAVIVDHGGGLHTGYWHLSKIDVQPGQEVKAGDKLGEVGTTGLSTGWHLHWEMRIGTTPVDPLPWLVRAFP
jgi:murein DD-endopeptidase MepM/ murein hydrolase activator NlpD